MSLIYSKSGVSFKRAESFVNNIKNNAQKTFNSSVVTSIGGFAGALKLSANIKQPLLVSGCDGVGTKLKLAFQYKIYNTVGIDLVAMSVNDILCTGASPLFFLDYIATGKIKTNILNQVMPGIIAGCQQAECVLLGGETAEMPGFYNENEFDLAGFAVGVVEQKNLLPQNIKNGDLILALASSGLHSNGFSLVRKIFANLKVDSLKKLKKYYPKKSTAQILLTPTKIYVKQILPLLKIVNLKAIAHITGGGIYENLGRLFPKNIYAEIDAQKIPVQNIFKFMQEEGKITDREMFKTFNMGVGLILVISPKDLQKVKNYFAKINENIYFIGEITSNKNQREKVKINF